MENKLAIFVCAHKEIECEIPNDDRYVILSQLKEIDSHGHRLIVIDDDFTKSHNVCYGEGCQMHWLWKHQEMLPDYIGFCHYRRYFDEFENNLDEVIPLVDKYGAIIKSSYYLGSNKTNEEVMCNRHIKSEAKALISSVRRLKNNKYVDAFNTMLNECYYNTCNIFIMKKEDFIEMCDIVFSILDDYNNAQSIHNNKDVRIRVLKSYIRDDIFKLKPISWHNRLHGFWLEWLTSAFYKYKYGNNCYETSCYTQSHTQSTLKQIINIDYSSSIINKCKLNKKIIYILTGNDEVMHKRLQLSLFSLKTFNECEVVLLTDTDTIFNDFISSNVTIKRIAIKEGNNKYKSRFLKTQITQFIEGSWIFLDVDTVVVGGLSDLDNINGISLAYEENDQYLNLSKIKYKFKNWDSPVFGHYYNSGVIIGSELDKKFFENWHKNFIDYNNQTSYILDQQPLSKTNKDMGFIINPLPSEYNWQIINKHKPIKDTKIIHYWGNGKFTTEKRLIIDKFINEGKYNLDELLKLRTFLFL